MSALVDVSPIRVACERAVATGQFQNWSQLARACGFTRQDRPNSGDVTNLKRRIRLKPSPFPIAYDTALRIADVLGLDPVDLGL